MEDLLKLAVATALINNVVLSQFLGLCPFLGVSKKTKTAAGMGFAVIFVLTISSAFASVVYEQVLVRFNVEYLETIVFILLIAALVQLVEIVLKKFSPSLYKALGVYLPLITTNCSVLGVVIINVQKEYGFVESIVNALGTGIGFTLAIVILAGLREKMEYNKISPAFKGMPIVLITAGLMAIAFSGFAGIL
ncbi:MAG: RnfABCDGE type electron transport complex subunit A [Lachnospiraceae bacterium]|nr:RnfABCDGE type electron transport complex subunit A [Lachnospiraceae bacterium]